MCLPLDDASNPLYNQAVSEQINRLINWPQYFHSAQALFSLPESYSQQEVTAAYRQLSRQIHPDKNVGIPGTSEAFSVINSAKEFLDFTLLSSVEKHDKLQQIVNNRFYKAELHNSFSKSSFWTRAGRYFTRDHEDFDNPTLYEEQGFSSILTVLERGRKQEELRKGNIKFCPFKLPSTAKKRLSTLMDQGPTSEEINIVDWLNLCRYPDDFDWFRQLCDYALTQKHQALLEQIKNFLPKVSRNGENTPVVDNLFAVIDARTAHFVMSQLSRFIDTQAQDELLHYFKEFQLNTSHQRRSISYHVITAFLGWHSSSAQLRHDIRADIERRWRYYNWNVDIDNVNIPHEELYFDIFRSVDFYSPTLCFLNERNKRKYFNTFISVLREHEVLTATEALYTAANWSCLDEINTILSTHPKLLFNPYYVLLQLVRIDIFDPDDEDEDDDYDINKIALPAEIKYTRENAIACITLLFKQILARIQFSPEQLAELFLLLLKNVLYQDTYTAQFILERMEECSLSDTLQDKIWRHCINMFIRPGDDSLFLNTLINHARPYFFDSIPLHHYLFETEDKPEFITKILRAEPRFLSCRYNDMPVMTRFPSYDLFAFHKRDSQYHFGTVSGLYLHHSLTTTNVYGIPKKSKACAIVEAIKTEDNALFNEPLAIPVYKNPEQYDIFQWFYKEPPLRYSRCDAMHIAAIRGLDNELLAMLQKGGDYHQKASVWTKSSFLGIETLILEQKSSYQYAKEQHLPQSCRWIVQQELKNYIAKRQNEESYLTRLSVCGYTLWNGGYKREDKIESAKALLFLMENTHFVGYGQDLFAANHYAHEYPALTQGRLGALFNLYKKTCQWYEDEQKNHENNYGWYKPPKENYADRRGFYEIESNNKYKPNWN